ncbi:DUF742 domain-containing protein [Nocardiopsis algeriensis]|uniref:DUF742 domain-containing protein n=1 Tax=Nocardiopsis algeriensis TaxID=1478215 RepID=A0A841IP55_9ACTN|nr:DUF742 domain-containing protein [Nocardiopsis algeriensis]MBB6119894.1 hypothetical protein [Nocardiopsis algeriensis]
MSAHDEEWPPDADLMRPYSLTGGRTRPSRTDLALTAQVVSVPGSLPSGADPELELIVSLCVHPLSVAEVASRAGLPLGVTRVLLADLADRGCVVVHTSSWEYRRPDTATLRSVLERIREL